ncbi:hypothetical protein [Methylocaldum sp.]|uniref:hypothetical protein n=1 Tax=Methylocaldum sp. TaxID=1969727 RepID=UPI002D391AD1|nr:hypothetical protein [Methylocaldum sp.]HYE38194.1 hypothetical protein [Methylocaldum sp.]
MGLRWIEDGCGGLVAFDQDGTDYAISPVYGDHGQAGYALAWTNKDRVRIGLRLHGTKEAAAAFVDAQMTAHVIDRDNFPAEVA